MGNKVIHERTPLNAEGDFYVEKDMCLFCMAPEYEAPELMGYEAGVGCYFKRQPSTPEETEHAIEAVRCSCIAALRYGGNDPAILTRLIVCGSAAECDELPSAGDI